MLFREINDAGAITQVMISLMGTISLGLLRIFEVTDIIRYLIAADNYRRGF